MRPWNVLAEKWIGCSWFSEYPSKQLCYYCVVAGAQKNHYSGRGAKFKVEERRENLGRTNNSVAICYHKKFSQPVANIFCFTSISQISKFLFCSVVPWYKEGILWNGGPNFSKLFKDLFSIARKSKHCFQKLQWYKGAHWNFPEKPVHEQFYILTMQQLCRQTKVYMSALCVNIMHFFNINQDTIYIGYPTYRLSIKVFQNS